MKTQGIASDDRIIRRAELAQRWGVSKTTLWRMVRRGELPAPLQISVGVVGWRLSTIDALLDKLEREAANGGGDAA